MIFDAGNELSSGTQMTGQSAEEKVLFGTNSPFGFFEVTKLTVDRAVLDHAVRRLIYGENMERILNEITLQKRGSYV